MAYCPPKEDPYTVPLTAVGNPNKYPVDLTTREAYINSSKLLCNSAIITYGQEYMCVNINIFYLGTPHDWYEYIWVPLVSPTNTQFNSLNYGNMQK